MAPYFGVRTHSVGSLLRSLGTRAIGAAAGHRMSSYPGLTDGSTEIVWLHHLATGFFFFFFLNLFALLTVVSTSWLPLLTGLSPHSLNYPSTLALEVTVSLGASPTEARQGSPSTRTYPTIRQQLLGYPSPISRPILDLNDKWCWFY